MARQFLFNPYIIDNLPIPSKGFDVVRDIQEPMLCLYITNRGVKSFFIRKRILGKDKRIIIGRYPEISIDEARDKIQYILKSSNHKIKYNQKILFKKIINLYLKNKVKRSKDSKIKLIKSIDKYLKVFFEMYIKDISDINIKNCLENIKGKYIKKRIHELLISIFNFAIENGYIKLNLAKQIPLEKINKRINPLNKSNFIKLFNSINKEKNFIIKNAFLMLIYGFSNKSKIFSMRWSDINFNNNMWNNNPLSDKALVLLQNLPQNDIYIFPNKSGFLLDPRNSWKDIVKKSNIDNLRISDIYKFLKSQLIYDSNKEIYRKNMNNLLLKLLK